MSGSIPISVKATLNIAAPSEVVWDYTQNWRLRREWDASVLDVVSIEETPHKKIKARFKGGATFSILYKINERPLRTGLAMTDSSSAWMIGGGGSWQYKRLEKTTEWTQQNTIVFRQHFLIQLLKPLIKTMLQATTKAAMRKAKKIIETRLTKDGQLT